MKIAKITEVMVDPNDAKRILIQFDPAVPVPMDGELHTEISILIPNFSPSGLKWLRSECLKKPEMRITEPLTRTAPRRTSLDSVKFDRYRCLDALYHSGKQRPCSASQCQKYAKEMVNGNWGTSGDRILFRDGQQRNGEHRMVSGFATGVPLEFDVLLEATNEDILNADRGKTRTNDQNAEITGLTTFNPEVMPTYSITKNALGRIYFESTGSPIQISAGLRKGIQCL